MLKVLLQSNKQWEQTVELTQTHWGEKRSLVNTYNLSNKEAETGLSEQT